MARYALARACVFPDEAFERLADCAARLVALCDGSPVIVRQAHVARPHREGSSVDGPALAVHRLDRPLSPLVAFNGEAGPAQGRHYETAAYVFCRPSAGDDASRLADAYDEARRAAGIPGALGAFPVVFLQPGRPLAFSGKQAA